MRNYSIYFIVVIAACVLMLFLPISTVRITASGFEDNQRIRTVEMTAIGKTEFLPDGNQTTKNILLPLCIVLTIVNSVIVLFVKDRSTKVKLCGLNYVFICASIVFVFYYCDFQTSVKNILVLSEYHAGAMMPFVQLLFNFGGIRKIKKG
jgi:hypothetical protein